MSYNIHVTGFHMYINRSGTNLLGLLFFLSTYGIQNQFHGSVRGRLIDQATTPWTAVFLITHFFVFVNQQGFTAN
jgi:hypothetical protein